MEQTKEKEILSKITEAFIIAILIMFPLLVDSTGFFKILEFKYRCFLVINAVYISSIAITIIYFLLFKETNIFKKLKLGKIHIALGAFWIINVISTFISPYFKKYNLFIGVGRAEGLISISLYALSFFNITMFGKFKRRYILYFSISSILINFISILQYIGFNPFNMYQDGIGTHNVSFIGTIGNVDFISALYCILLTVPMAAYVFLEDNSKFEKIIYLISIYMGFFIFEVLDVLGGSVALAGILILTIPFIISNNKRLSRLLIIGSMILFGYFTNITINPTYHYDIGKLNLEFQINAISIGLLIVSIAFIVLALALKKSEYDISENKKIIKKMYIGMALLVLVGIVVLFCYNFSSGFLHEIHELLHGNFDDDFGTYRIFLWKRSIKLIKDYPILGTGPDTFAVRFMGKYAKDVARLGELTINDTAANSYLTIAVNTGVLGIITYLTFIILQLKKTLKNKNKYSIIFLTAFICFLIQDFFNLWVVIIIPIFWVLMAIMYLASIDENTNETEEKNE